MTAEVVRFPAGVHPEIARLREITAESANNGLLGAGPPHPDAALLDLCAEALHLLTRAEKALAAGRRMIALKQSRQACDEPFESRDHDIARAKPLLRQIAKLPAATAAGIYAKALVVRASRTGAPMLAMTLAADLIACPGLRASLWPAAPAACDDGESD